MGSSVLDPKPLLSDIRKELQKSYLSMSTDLRKIDNELKFMKGIVHRAFMLSLDTRYKGGFERVESSYKTFLNGAKNLKVTLENISAFIFELETEANHCFNLEHIESYLSMSSEFQSLDESKDIFKYIVFVRAKYLQISSKNPKPLFGAFGQTEKTGFKVFGSFQPGLPRKVPQSP